MNNEMMELTDNHGNFLILLLLAHIISDFILQTKAMVANKRWFSTHMIYHVIIIFGITLLFIGSWKIALLIALTHWIIDGTKFTVKDKLKNISELNLFVGDQILHILVIIGIWCFKFDLFGKCSEMIQATFANFKWNLLILAYAIIIWPVGYLIRFVLHKLEPPNPSAEFEHGGKLIGQFERIIILTFVILGEYDAIGFLITGKSIIRFAQTRGEIKSEYVLAGTMMSYALTIVIGVILKQLLAV